MKKKKGEISFGALWLGILAVLLYAGGKNLQIQWYQKSGDMFQFIVCNFISCVLLTLAYSIVDKIKARKQES